MAWKFKCPFCQLPKQYTADGLNQHAIKRHNMTAEVVTGLGGTYRLKLNSIKKPTVKEPEDGATPTP